MKIGREEFFALQSRMASVPFSQSAGWNAYRSGRNRIDYFVDSAESPGIAVWGRRFHLPFLGDILQIQGEAQNEPSASAVAALYGEIFNSGYAMVILDSVAEPSAEREIAMRKAGFVRPYGYTLCPLTILCNLEEPEHRHGSWRKNLKKAAAAGLKFYHVPRPTPEDCRRFAGMFAEMSGGKHMHYVVGEDEVATLLCDPDFKLFFVSAPDGTPLTGSIVYGHGEQSCGVYTANSSAGRANGSSYLIKEEVFKFLPQYGIKVFDMGRIAPGLGAINSVYEFKMLSGGRPVQYFGEWVRAKSKYVELAYLIYRQFLKPGARY